MNNLRNLTKEEHRRAERTTFMNRMLKRQITPEQYYVYLKNQLFMYSTLEFYATAAGIFDGGLESITRSTSLLEDILKMELENGFKDHSILRSSYDYVEHIQSIKDDTEKLLAHVYVRHMGDLSGGQIIKKLIPGPTSFYEFNDDVNNIKNLLHSKLYDGLESEAKICFNMVQKFLEELEEYFGDMDQTK